MVYDHVYATIIPKNITMEIMTTIDDEDNNIIVYYIIIRLKRASATQNGAQKFFSVRFCTTPNKRRQRWFIYIAAVRIWKLSKDL